MDLCPPDLGEIKAVWSGKKSSIYIVVLDNILVSESTVYGGGRGGQVHCRLVYMLMCTSLDIKRIMFSISVKYSSRFSFLVNKKMKTPGSSDGVFTENIPPLRTLQCSTVDYQPALSAS